MSPSGELHVVRVLLHNTRANISPKGEAIRSTCSSRTWRAVASVQIMAHASRSAGRRRQGTQPHYCSRLNLPVTPDTCTDRTPGCRCTTQQGRPYSNGRNHTLDPVLRWPPRQMVQATVTIPIITIPPTTTITATTTTTTTPRVHTPK